MGNSKMDNAEREQRILDAAAALIVRYGYDKTTMNDIADEAGVTRAIAYIHFKNKDALFETLLYRETQKYMQAWLDDFEANPRAGRISDAFRSALAAVNRSPFLSAMMKQDQRVFGGYLRKPGNLFESIQIGSIWVETLRLLRTAGAIREDVNPTLFSYIMNALSLGLMIMQGDKKFGDPPPFDDLMTGIADMLDRTLTQANGGNQEAGQAILRQIALAARAQFEGSRLEER
jgi:AcrR family transcriptional regulator